MCQGVVRILNLCVSTHSVPLNYSPNAEVNSASKFTWDGSFESDWIQDERSAQVMAKGAVSVVAKLGFETSSCLPVGVQDLANLGPTTDGESDVQFKVSGYIYLLYDSPKNQPISPWAHVRRASWSWVAHSQVRPLFSQFGANNSSKIGCTI